jgi:hypothetical protein
MADLYLIDAPNILAEYSVAEPFEPIVEFYRSEKSANGKFGAADDDYKGQFGFDWYDAEVDGEGKTVKSAFDQLTIAGQEYLVPWLVLWPPKSVLSKYPNIDSSFKPVNKASLCLKINEGLLTGRESGSVKLKSSSSFLTINNSQKIVLSDLKIGRTSSLVVELNGELVQNEYIEVITMNTNKVIGKLNVLKNNSIKVVSPTMFNVQVGNQKSTSITTSALTTSYDTCFNFLQQNSLNQALVYIKKPLQSENFTIDENDLKGYHKYDTPVYIDHDDDNQQVFLNALIETWYQLKTGDVVIPEINSANNDLDLTPLRSVGAKMIKGIQKSFEKYQGKPNRLALSLSENQNLIDKYNKKRSEFPEILPEAGKSNLKMNTKAEAYWQKEATNNDLLLFAIPGIENFKFADGLHTNPGWSVNGKNTITALNELFTSNGAVAHEFGHAFGLGHTFSDKKVEPKKKEVAVLDESKISKFIIGQIDQAYKNFVGDRKELCFKDYGNQKWTIENLKITLDELKEKALMEESTFPEQTNHTATISTPDLEEIVLPLKEGDTKENFMDYIDPDSNRKSFTIEQMQTINTIQ